MSKRTTAKNVASVVYGYPSTTDFGGRVWGANALNAMSPPHVTLPSIVRLSAVDAIGTITVESGPRRFRGQGTIERTET